MNEQTKMAASSGAATRVEGANNGGLPRLGSPGATTRPDLRTEVVVIPERGVSVVLRKPSVNIVLAAQERVDKIAEGDSRAQYESTVWLVSAMLVEPAVSEEELRAEVDEWSFEDWRILQDAALKLAGLGEEAAQETRAEFRQPQK